MEIILILIGVIIGGAIVYAMVMKKVAQQPDNTASNTGFSLLMQQVQELQKTVDQKLGDSEKCKIDTSRFGLLGFRHTMPPMVLERTAHQQQATVGEFDINGFAGFIMAYLKQPFRA